MRPLLAALLFSSCLGECYLDEHCQPPVPGGHCCAGRTCGEARKVCIEYHCMTRCGQRDAGSDDAT